jgi:hypothetical protein
MGDIESYLRMKFRQESSKGTFFLRNPKLTDEENALLHRPYCGNPFIAPGTIGAKSQHKNISPFLDESYAFFEDTMMPNSENYDNISNKSTS